MIVYSNTKVGFESDVLNSTIDEKVEQAVYEKLGHHTGIGEIHSWQNSLHRMGEVLSDPSIPDNAGIAVEYGIPYTPKRVDMIVSGKDDDNHNDAVIIELKQWSEVSEIEEKDGIITTTLGGSKVETVHPSYQAAIYAQLLRDFNEEVQNGDITLHPCTYLHNYLPQPVNDPLTSSTYQNYIRIAPVFTKHDASRLRIFINRFIKKGDDGETIFRIEKGKLRPAKSLQDCIASMIKGNPEFNLVDEQKVVYEMIKDHARRTVSGGKKQTIIVCGGPGTGKSVLAVHLLADLLSDGMSAAYVTRNAAPRNVYSVRLKKTHAISRVDCLFKSSGSFIDAPENAFDVLLTDEAHRLNEKSGMFSNKGINQIMEIIHASRLSVFFIDEDQQVILKDIGTIKDIKDWAHRLGSEIFITNLESQFRCNGSDNYLSWLNDVLELHPTANPVLADSTYDFRVFDNPYELRRIIEEKNRIDNKSRMVAGYCWNWVSKKENDQMYDITLSGGFQMRWNLDNTKTWAIDPDSVQQAGCIHTCQGLEFDYIGVIIGPDLVYQNGKIVTNASERAKTDASLKGLHKKYPDKKEASKVADRIIKNTYKVLMTRGMKGCYVYCTDKALSDYLKHRLKMNY